MNDFKARAQLLGLDPNTAFSGKVTVTSLDQLKQILNVSGLVPDHATLMGGAAASDNPTDAVTRAVAQHVYSNEPLSDADRALADTAFPLQLNVVSQSDMTIDSEWNLNTLASEGPIVVSLGTLTIEDGGYIVVSNRSLDFTADTLVRTGSTQPPNNAGIFNILGTTGAQGKPGTTPTAPGQAGNGAPGNCSSAGIAGKSGGDGTPGTKGGTGGPGAPGDPGKPSLSATIRVTTSVQSSSALTVVTQSGSGGKGGTGGAGSKGGQGGNGGNGATCGCTGSSGGSGAQGGQGGDGGPGGQGGNAVDAAGNIIFYVPKASVGLIVPIRLTAQPGAGGDGGEGGQGGGGGGAGSGGKHNSGGSSGGSGGQGTGGQPGLAGTATGAAAQINIQPL